MLHNVKRNRQEEMIMRKLINNWHYVSVYLAGITALAAIMVTDDITQKLLLAAITMMFLKFFLKNLVFRAAFR